MECVGKSDVTREPSPCHTNDEAIEEINGILDNHSDGENQCTVTFDLTNAENEPMVEISNSYLVDSRYDRQKISTIIENTGVTSREFDNMSSEWLAHNIATAIPSLYDKGHSVGIDYKGDYRWYVTFPTKVLEILGWE